MKDDFAGRPPNVDFILIVDLLGRPRPEVAIVDADDWHRPLAVITSHVRVGPAATGHAATAPRAVGFMSPPMCVQFLGDGLMRASPP